MRKFGLIGFPLGHSFSKKYFSEKFLKERIFDCSYENFPLQDLSVFTGLVGSDSELEGLNVTIPYKSEIMKFLTSVEPEASEIGAVNVIKIKREQRDQIKLIGFNSDITGLRDTLFPLAEGIENALILGTGGSSRAVSYVLRKAGISFNTVSRERKPGALTYSDINSEILDKSLLIINTTPRGMFPDIEGKPEINYSRLTQNHILFDLVYNPEFTSFLQMGAEHGCRTISGLKMLYSQAERAWQIWNDDKL